MRILTAALLLAASTSVLAEARSYQIDPNHTQVRFQYSHFGLSTIVGLFTGISGEISYDPANPAASTVRVNIPISEVNTGVADFNDHLRSADFFDVARYPTASFSSRTVESLGEGRLRVTGDLSLRDQTHEVVLEAVLRGPKDHPMSGRPAIGVDASTQLRRTVLGVGKYAPNVSDEVELTLTVEATVPKSAQ